MNLYFIVEGRRTEKRVYKSWIPIIFPGLEPVNKFSDLGGNHFYIISSEGYPPCEQFIADAVKELELNSQITIDHLFFCFDADEEGTDVRRESIEKILAPVQQLLTPVHYSIIVQNRCIESWFLGNQKIFTQSPAASDFLACLEHYSVLDNDPELLEKPDGYQGTYANCHSIYLIKAMKNSGLRYSKTNPGAVQQDHFLQEIIKRARATDHLQSMKFFLDVCCRLGAKC
ncbi:hypothetical protein [Candidatus Magnetaquicoccus inordinatus]|uniref:hypothetical protein n=1 Tax=Candidatus Magnetaquicoccus inordinatus TaxID=2496818 RepID=UPI00102C9DB5|nr:hypothetical protein [Candidatus Magnetaquicoccus inordinatus]